MVRPHHRLQGTLLVVLFLTLAFAGCFDKRGKDEAAAATDPFERMRVDPLGEPVSIDDYERFLVENGARACEGCIPVQPPQPVRKAAPPPVTVTVPLPNDDDRFRVQGVADQMQRGTRTGLPLDEGRGYALYMRFKGVDDDTARLEVERADWEFDAGPAPVVTSAVLNVSLSSRLVTSAELSGHATIDRLVGSEMRRLTNTAEPTLETLFWLGAHVWGRTLQEHETFTTRWLLPGTTEEALRFEYLVTRVSSPEGGRHAVAHDRWHLPGALHLEVRVVDRYGNDGRWTMIFDEGSPYPRRIHGGETYLVSDATPYLPMMALQQEIGLMHRGHDPLPWRSDVVRARVQAEPTDSGFWLRERIASPVLDTLPLYPLHMALADLRVLDADFARFQDVTPDAVVLEARYTTQATTVPEVLRHVWQLAFLGNEGRTEAWAVGRLSTQGVLTAVPLEEDVHSSPPEAVASFLHERPHLDPLLASGEEGAGHLAALGVTHVDRLHYRLEPHGVDRLGGTLTASRHLVSRTGLPEAEPLGFFTQDLATRRLVERGSLETL